jgi:hypothetical protein
LAAITMPVAAAWRAHKHGGLGLFSWRPLS